MSALARPEPDKQEKGKDKHDLNLTEKEKIKIMFILVVIIFLLVVVVSFYNSLNGNKVPSLGTCKNESLAGGQSACISEYAIATGNLSACNILQSGAKGYCISTVATDERNISACIWINASSPYYYGCITYLASGLQDLSYCNSMPQSYGLMCIDNVSARSNYSSVEGCDSLTNDTYALECRTIYYFESAMLTRSVADCGMLSSTYNQTVIDTMLQAPAENYSANSTVGSLVYLSLNVSPQDFCESKIGACTLTEGADRQVTCSS